MNNKTNLGGAISMVGTTLIGVGLLPQLGGAHSSVLWYIALAGFILDSIGKGATAYFAADAKVVSNIATAVDTINRIGSNPVAAPSTETITKP